MTTLLPFGDDLWVRSDPLRLAGAEFGHRMTVARMADGDLWLHSPVACSPALLDELRALGRPRWLVAPSCFHDLYLAEWFEACPELTGYAPRRLLERKPEKGCTLALEDGPLPWGDAVGHVHLAGMPKVDEFDFFHRASRTLILADLAFHLDREQSWIGRAFLRLFGAYGGVRTSRLFRSMIRDREAFRRSVREVIELPFERVVFGHGANLEGAEAAKFREHLAQLAGS